MKLSARHVRDDGREDVVTQRAQELRVTPEEVFARAFAEAGKSRMASGAAFIRYCRKETQYEIPPLVREYCKKPLPTCANLACQNPKARASFTRTATGGKTAYFCSQECMDATPKTVVHQNQEVSETTEGRAILERVRVAMSNAVYVKVPPHKIRPMAGQPREYFGSESMRRLGDSLKRVGQMTPGIIRAIEQDTNGCEYELLDGERRLRAARKVELTEYRAMLVEIDNEAAPYVVSVISNFNREEHTLLELSDAVVKMHEGLRLSMYEISDVLGLPDHNEASKLYGLRRLIPEVRDMLDPTLVKGHPLPKLAAIKISREDQKDQLGLARKMINREITLTGLTEHIRNSAEARGNRVRERTPSPDDRRKLVKRRIDTIQNMAHDLALIMEKSDVPAALKGFPPFFLRELKEKLEAAMRELSTCCEVLQRTLKKDTDAIAQNPEIGSA